MVSRKAKYALLACIAIARRGGDAVCLIDDIAREEELPRKFLETILLDLRHAGILQSKKGRGGGYSLARPADLISMHDVLRAIDGPIIPFRCVAIREDKTCEECRGASTCPLNPTFRALRDDLEATLGERTLSDLAIESRRLREQTEGLSVYQI